MKITIVLGAFFPVPPIMGGGVEKVWFALGKEFARRGHEIVLISRAFSNLPETETAEGVKHVRVKGFDQPRSLVRLKLFDLIYSFRVRQILPEADILITNTFWLPMLVRERRHGLVYVHVARWPRGQMRWYARAVRLQAVSRAIGEAIIAQAQQLQTKVRVIPNAIISPEILQNNGAREKTILFVGRIHPEKGLQMLLRALPRLSDDIRADWRLTMIGPHAIHFGGGGDSFLRRVQELGRRSGMEVDWLGPVFDDTQLAVHYRKALIFIYPSLAEQGEALPIAPLEAAANGCAPFVSGLDCFSDYIQNGVTGFVFDHRGEMGVENLTRRLTDVLRLGETEITKIGAAARAQASKFALEPVATRYLDDFASLLAQDRH